MFYLPKENLHHAYLFEGDREVLRAELFEYLEKELLITVRGNPDVNERDTDTFGIDEARALGGRAGLRSALGGKKIFIISTRVVTDQAQNALLKLFEEPTPETHFFLITSNVLELLPTLRSRMIQVSVKHEGGEIKTNPKIKTFIKATPAKRLDIVAEVLKEVHKDEEKGLVKGRALQFLTELELELHKSLDMSKLSTDEELFFRELIHVREYISDQGSSVKMLLEHVTLLLPRY